MNSSNKIPKKGSTGSRHTPLSTSQKYDGDLPIVESVAEFLEFIKELEKPDTSKGSKVLFRGQENKNWEIQTSAYRRLRLESMQKKVSKEYEWNYNRGLMEQFKHADFSSGYSSEIMKEDLGILAQLQHSGAATSLIDFSDNPLIALWFACKKPLENKGKDNNNGKVFILYTGSKKNIKKNIKEHLEEIDVFEPIENYKGIYSKKLKYPNKKLFYWKPAHLNKRIAAQQSYFLIDKKEIPAMPEMLKVIIQGNSKDDILEELSSLYGINEIMLFPDFVGFAQANSVHSPYNKEDEYLKNNMTVRYYDKIIKKKSKDFQAFNNRGSAKHELGEYKDAIKDFDKVIEYKPKYANAYYNRGNAKCELGNAKCKLGNTEYNAKCELGTPKCKLGNTKYKLKYYKDAIKDFNEAININQDDGYAYYNRGLAKLIIGNIELKLKYYQKAIDDFNKSIKIDSKDANAYNHRGNAKRGLKDYKGAIKDFREAININPNHAYAQENLNEATSEFNDYEEEFEYFTTDVKNELIGYVAYYNLK